MSATSDAATEGKLVLLVRHMMEVEESKRGVIRAEAAKSDSKVGAILHGVDSLRTLMTLSRFGGHFTKSKVFTVAWQKSAMHDVHGGILAEVIETNASILRFLFQGASLAIAAPELAQVLGTVGPVDPNRLSQEDLDIRVARVWNQIRRTGDQFANGLLTEKLLEQLDHAFAKTFVAASDSTVETRTLVGTSNVLLAPYYTAYFREVTDILKEEIVESTWRHDEEQAIANTIISKLHWLSHVHEDYESLPLLTKSMIIGISDGLSVTPRAICEVVRWLQPLIDYERVHRQGTAMDYTSQMLSAIREGGVRFRDGAKTARILARYLIQQRDDLVQFEGYIRSSRSSESLRPTSKADMEAYFSAGAMKAKWIGGTPEMLKKEYNQLMTAMANARRKCGYAKLNNFCVATTAWPWQKSRNKSRDWPVVVMAAILEKRLVRHYRPALLQRSPAAVRLRDGIAELLRAQQGARWTYPDGITVNAPAQVEGEKFDLEKIVWREDAMARRVTATKAVQAIVSKIERLPFARIELDKKSAVAAEVRGAVKELTRALSVNYAVLEKIRRSRKDGEEDIALDPKWFKEFNTPANIFAIEFAEAEASGDEDDGDEENSEGAVTPKLSTKRGNTTAQRTKAVLKPTVMVKKRKSRHDSMSTAEDSGPERADAVVAKRIGKAPKVNGKGEELTGDDFSDIEMDNTIIQRRALCDGSMLTDV